MSVAELWCYDERVKVVRFGNFSFRQNLVQTSGSWLAFLSGGNSEWPPEPLFHRFQQNRELMHDWEDNGKTICTINSQHGFKYLSQKRSVRKQSEREWSNSSEFFT